MHADLVTDTGTDIDAGAAGGPIASLRERLGELADIDGAASLLTWDQQTMMPPGGAEARADQLGTLERLYHDRLIAPEVGDWLGALAAGDGDEASVGGDPENRGDRDAALLRVVRRDR